MIDPEAQLQMDVLAKMRDSEDKDVQWLLWRLGIELGDEDNHAAVKSFRRQIIVAAAGYAVTNGDRQ